MPPITIEDVERAFAASNFELTKRTKKVSEFRSFVTGHFVYFEKQSGLPNTIHIVTDPRVGLGREAKDAYKHSNLARFPKHSFNGKTAIHFGVDHQIGSVADLLRFLEGLNSARDNVSDLSNIDPINPSHVTGLPQSNVGQLETVSQVPVSKLEALRKLTPSQFEDLVVTLYRKRGYEAERTGSVGDHGVDVVVHTPEREKWIVQCKRWRGTVGEPMVRDFYGTMQHEKADQGEIFTTGNYTPQALDWIRGKPITLYSGSALLDLMDELGLSVEQITGNKV